MNLELLESFGQNYPEEFDGALDCASLAVTCDFNRRGSLLAVGCNDGRIVVWDFLTRGIAKIISAHVHPVCSVSWSRAGYKLVSVSTDNNVCIWDVLSGECDVKYRFPSPVMKVQFHPRNDKMFLVCPMRHPAVLVKVDNTENPHQIVPLDDEGESDVAWASFSRRGDGKSMRKSIRRLLLPDLKARKTLRRRAGHRMGSGGNSTSFLNKSFFLVNSADRVIRVYNSKDCLSAGKDGDLEPTQKLQDLVNKTMWKKCCFSGDGEYICAGSARQHSLYIWERSIGNLVKILHGTKGEMLLDVVWHPVRPILASISSGVVSVWSQNQVENWSAFAPDFKELDENVEYEERESEFDQEDEDKSVELSQEKREEDVEVDVITNEPVAAFCSSDEDDDSNTLLYLPISPEIEEPEEGWGPEGAPGEELSNKRSGDGKENSSPKKKRPKTLDVSLENAPTDEVHPLTSGRQKDKSGGQGKKGRNNSKGDSKKDRKKH
ncbi:unnamed protein product, partial [Meganyctiphanes norvegica]